MLANVYPREVGQEGQGQRQHETYSNTPVTVGGSAAYSGSSGTPSPRWATKGHSCRSPLTTEMSRTLAVISATLACCHGDQSAGGDDGPPVDLGKSANGLRAAGHEDAF